VKLYPHFHQAGYKIQPGIAKWIQDNSDTVLGWLLHILKISSKVLRRHSDRLKSEHLDNATKD